MNSKDFLKEGFIEDASDVHMDHEVQMAREECYHAAEHALAIHKLLRNISEQQGLEGWVSSKITLANDYLNTVREHLEYELLQPQIDDAALGMPIAENYQQGVAAGSEKSISEETNSENLNPQGIKVGDFVSGRKRDGERYKGVVTKIYRDPHGPNIPLAYVAILSGLGITSAVRELTLDPEKYHGLAEGTKCNHTMEESLSDEQRAEHERQLSDFVRGGGQIERLRAQKGPRRSGASLGSKHIGGRSDAQSGKRSQTRGLGSSPTGKLLVAKEDMNAWKKQQRALMRETSAGSVAGVVNSKSKKPKSQVGSLFGGTYKQQKKKA